MFINQLHERTQFSAQEKVGLEYCQEVRHIIQNAQRHRGTAALYLGGETTALGNLVELQEDIDGFIERIDQQNASYGNPLSLDEEWQLQKKTIGILSEIILRILNWPNLLSYIRNL